MLENSTLHKFWWCYHAIFHIMSYSIEPDFLYDYGKNVYYYLLTLLKIVSLHDQKITDFGYEQYWKCYISSQCTVWCYNVCSIIYKLCWILIRLLVDTVFFNFIFIIYQSNVLSIDLFIVRLYQEITYHIYLFQNITMIIILIYVLFIIAIG